MKIESISELPESFAALALDAYAEGYDFLEKMHNEWVSNTNRFSKLNEILFAVTDGPTLVAIGGVNIDPYLNDPSVGRIRHLYVEKTHRRRGVGKQLLETLLLHSQKRFRRVRLRTRNLAAVEFYRSFGFVRVANESEPEVANMEKRFGKIFAESADQNKEPILKILREHLGPRTHILEVASGTGQHVSFFASHFPDKIFHPSESNETLFASIEAYCESLENVRRPLLLDAQTQTWPKLKFDAIVNINMIHISDFAACEGLFAGARQVLASHGRILLYGPFFEDEVKPVASNLSFDQWLKSKNPNWGVRRIEDVCRVANSNEMFLAHRIEMPANNLILVFERES